MLRLKGDAALLCAMEADAVPAAAQPVTSGIAFREDLERHGPAHFFVLRRRNLEELMVADIQDHETSFDEAETVGSGRQAMAAEFERIVGQQISLIFLLQR